MSTDRAEKIPEISGDETGLVPPATPQADWPKLRTLTATELDRLAVDEQGRFHWDGKPVSGPVAGRPGGAEMTLPNTKPAELTAVTDPFDVIAAEIMQSARRELDGLHGDAPKAAGPAEASQPAADVTPIEVAVAELIAVAEPTAAPKPEPASATEAVPAAPEPVAAAPEPVAAAPEPVAAAPEPVAAAPEPSVAPQAAVPPEPVIAPAPIIAPEAIIAPEPIIASQPKAAAQPGLAVTEPARPSHLATIPRPEERRIEPVLASPRETAAMLPPPVFMRPERVRVSFSFWQSLGVLLLALSALLAAAGIGALGFVAAHDWGCKTGLTARYCPQPVAPAAPPARPDIPA